IRARSAVVAVGAWTSDVLGSAVQLPQLQVTQEQPAHFPLRDPSSAWPAFTVDPDPAEDWPSRVYGLASPGAGVKVGFHGTGRGGAVRVGCARRAALRLLPARPGGIGRAVETRRPARRASGGRATPRRACQRRGAGSRSRIVHRLPPPADQRVLHTWPVREVR